MPCKKRRIAYLCSIQLGLIRECKRDFEPSNVHHGFCKDDVLYGSQRKLPDDTTALTPICASSNTRSLYTSLGSPSVLTGTASKRSLTHPSNVSRLSFPSTTNFILFAQYSLSHHSINSRLGSLPSALGFSHSVSLVPVPNLLYGCVGADKCFSN